MFFFYVVFCFFFFFFFQAEDGIRDLYVTGVQTCALPISPWLFGGLNHLYLALLRSWAPSPLATGALRLALSLAVLVPPTALMGATLPLLSRALVREPGRAGADVGTLYALNTWGAVVGTAATGFWLLPLVGVRATVVIGVALDLAVAGVALALARR